MTQHVKLCMLSGLSSVIVCLLVLSLIGSMGVTTGVGPASVGTAQVKTATGSFTSAGVSFNVTMNDYSFSPSMSSTSVPTASHLAPWSGTDPSNTIAAYSVTDNSGTHTARWRYMTASDNPTVWVAYRTLTGEIVGSWVSDDPVLPNNPQPFTMLDALTHLPDPLISYTTISAADILRDGGLTAQDMQQGDTMIESKRWSPQHRAYRAVQAKTGDDAPAHWYADTFCIDPTSKTPVRKGTC